MNKIPKCCEFCKYSETEYSRLYCNKMHIEVARFDVCTQFKSKYNLEDFDIYKNCKHLVEKNRLQYCDLMSMSVKCHVCHKCDEPYYERKNKGVI